MADARQGISLFTGAGIGDLGFRAAGVDLRVMSELEPDRASLARVNFPSATMVVGDIRHAGDTIVKAAREVLDGECFLLSITAPCQGMSRNGKGKLLALIRDGRRPELDPRNRLVLPALEVVKALRPRWVFFENVSEMANTVIKDNRGAGSLILDVIRETLEPDYAGRAYDLEFADFGVPQRRRRLLTIYTRSDAGRRHLAAGGEFVPPATHAKSPCDGRRPWISVEEALAGFPPLDASTPGSASDLSIPFHRVPLLDARKYEWVRATPPSRSAFDNQCASCGFDDNAAHGASRDRLGVNRAHSTTPILCQSCGALLPRPHVVDESGRPRIMKGYTSAYKRMRADLPAPALTRNLSYACSDQKLHPSENRVLSLAEAFRLHSLDRYQYAWGPVTTRSGKRRPIAPDSLIRLALGESIPPMINELVLQHISLIEEGAAAPAPGQSALHASG